MENEDVRTVIRDTRNLAWVVTDLCVQGNGVEGGFFQNEKAFTIFKC